MGQFPRGDTAAARHCNHGDASRTEQAMARPPERRAAVPGHRLRTGLRTLPGGIRTKSLSKESAEVAIRAPAKGSRELFDMLAVDVIPPDQRSAPVDFERHRAVASNCPSAADDELNVKVLVIRINVRMLAAVLL